MPKPEYNDHAARWNYMQELLEEAQPKQATDQKRKYIRRVDDEERKAHYWQINLVYNRKRHFKTFADKKCGGKTSALLAAVAYRDKLIKELGIIFKKGLKKSPVHPESEGIYFKQKTSGKYTYDYWMAYWHEPGIDGKQVRKFKSFSVHKYGKIRAKQKAKKYREDKIKELYG